MHNSSSAYLFEQFTIPQNANYFSFNFKFNQIGEGDYLTAHFDDNLLFWFEGTEFYGNDYWNSGLLNITKYAGKTGTWTFGLNDAGPADSELWIDDWRFFNVRVESLEEPGANVVPEPSSFALLGIGFLGSICLCSKQRRRS